jgi:hypothetical protein
MKGMPVTTHAYTSLSVQSAVHGLPILSFGSLDVTTSKVRSAG